jgi:hypothetical protein
VKISEGTTYRPALSDYALSGVSSALAVFAAPMAILAPGAAAVLVSIVAFGTLVSWVIQRSVPERTLERIGAIPYAITAILAVIIARQLGTVLPDNPFAPRELAVSGILCWMIALGAFTAWTEGTLLFQAVPSIALFGLVGSYGTYQNATYAFFAFMLCFATLFSRSHARRMLRQAARAGYGSRTIGDGITTAPTFEEMLRGPWRWAAGPGWALASAGVVILLSLIGAPVIQESVRGVSGVVKVSMPVSVGRAAPR